jgi:hypothetical protein
MTWHLITQTYIKIFMRQYIISLTDILRAYFLYNLIWMLQAMILEDLLQLIIIYLILHFKPGRYIFLNLLLH